MSTSQTIGAAVAAARKRRHMTKSELAAAARIDPSTVTRIERGDHRDIGVLTLSAIARVLGVSVDSLLDPPRSRRRRAA